MTVDYDLVVIGASAAGIAAAKTAVQYHARVALVQQGEIYSALPVCVSLLQQRAQQARGSTPNFSKIAQFLEILTLQQQASNSLDSLAALGIDVIPASGAFYRKPRVGFAIADRTLTSRAYLLACSLGSTPQTSASEWSLNDFPQRLAELEQKQHILIRGTSPESVAIAQALAQLGKQVALVEPEKSLLADVLNGLPELAHRLQMQLEAAGVQVRFSDQISDQNSVDADVILQGSLDQRLDAKKLNLAGLNLGVARVRWNRERIFVDRYGRASRKVYVTVPDCPARAIAATHHALKLPWGRKTTPPENLTILTNPELVTIGLTPAQAKRRYGKIYVLGQSLNQSAKAQILEQNAGHCHLIVRSHGRLVGAQILAPQASETAAVLALAIQQQQSVNAIADLDLPHPTLAEWLQQAAIDYRCQARQSDLWRYGLEEFFAWRRYWAR